jgi:arginyl-tRNA synthetase
MARPAIAALRRSALAEATARHGWVLETPPAFVIEPTRDPDRGDWASNLALSLARPLKLPPMAVAQAIAGAVTKGDAVAQVTVAPPGFLNFRLSRHYLLEALMRCQTRSPQTEALGFKLATVVADYEVGAWRDGTVRLYDQGKPVTDRSALTDDERRALCFHLLTQAGAQGLRLDLSEVRREVLDNPWTYVRQALDRMGGILDTARAEGLSPLTVFDEAMLAGPEERRLLLLIAGVEGEMGLSLELGQMSRLTRAATDLATGFHQFYAACRVFGEDEEVARARLALIAATRQGLQAVLSPLEPMPDSCAT